MHNVQVVLIGAALIMLSICLTTMIGCISTPTPTTNPTAQEQQALTIIQGTVQAAELAYALADAAGVVPPPDEVIAAAAQKAVDAALIQAQTAINAGDTNGFNIALQSAQAGLTQLLPIIHTAAPKAKAKLKH